jgi:hypothetical protein
MKNKQERKHVEETDLGKISDAVVEIYMQKRKEFEENMKSKKERKKQAWEEYVKTIRPIQEEYERIRQSALEEYKVKCKEIDEE